MPDSKQVKQQLKEAGLGRLELMSAGKELLILAGALGEDEPIEAAVAGEFDDVKGLAVATPQRVLFVAGTIFKQKSESLVYEKISSVQAEARRLVVYTSGNSAALDKIINANAARVFADYVRARLNDGQKTAAPPPADDIPAKLEQIARLRDQGILSEDEFQTQKAKLLERL